MKTSVTVNIDVSDASNLAQWLKDHVEKPTPMSMKSVGGRWLVTVKFDEVADAVMFRMVW